MIVENFMMMMRWVVKEKVLESDGSRKEGGWEKEEGIRAAYEG